MKTGLRITVLLLTALLLLGWVLPAAAADSSSGGDLGTVTVCAYDTAAMTVKVAGTVNHKVMTATKNGKIALFRLKPWESAESAVAVSEPLAVVNMTIRFEFTVACDTLEDRLSQYAVVIIGTDGGRRLLASPHYTDCTSSDSSSLGYKGVETSYSSAAVEAGAGSAVVDIMLDRLESGKQSGYFFSAGNMNFYFDRDYINELDKTIRSYYASGADVILRFLISADGKSLACAAKTANGALYRGIVIGDTAALITVYAYTYFLASRYDTSSYGEIAGIIIGRGADLPGVYNYSASVGDYYNEVYARTLSVTGIAAAEASGDGKLCLIVPVTSALDGKGGCSCTGFLSGVAEYITGRTSLSLSVMCESLQNPYGIYDEYFLVPEDTEPEDTEPENTAPESGGITGDGTSARNPENTAEPLPETTSPAVPADITLPAETLPSPEEPPAETEADDTGDPDAAEPAEPGSARKYPVRNDMSDGYFTTDNINVFGYTIRQLRSQYDAVNDGFIWCWYPGENTVAGALSVCYAYNYLQLAAYGADTFIVSFNDSGDDGFSHLSHMFKYISTERSGNETLYARSVFGVDSWGAIIDGWNSSTGVYETITERTLSMSSQGIAGSYMMWDFASQAGTQDWYAGLGCGTLQSISGSEGRSLKAYMYTDELTGSYSDIGYICEYPEPLLYCDCLSFDILCGENDGSLYEVKIKIYARELKIEDNAVVVAGKRTTLYLDTGLFPEDTEIDAVRICVKRVTGNGGFDFHVFGIAVNSLTFDDETLYSMMQLARRDFRNPAQKPDGTVTRIIAAAAIVAGAVVLTVVAALYSDKRHRAAGRTDKNG